MSVEIMEKTGEYLNKFISEHISNSSKVGNIKKNPHFKFYSSEETDRVICELVPYQKVVAITSIVEDKLFELKKNLLSEGVELIILCEKNLNDVKTISNLFSLPEDIRGVLVWTEDNFMAGGYFSEIRQIPLILNVKDNISTEIFKRKILINNYGIFDEVYFQNEIHVLLPENKKIYKSAVVNLIELLLSSLDYITICLVNKTPLNSDYLSLVFETYKNLCNKNFSKSEIIKGYFTLALNKYIISDNNVLSLIESLKLLKGRCKTNENISILCAYMEILRRISSIDTDKINDIYTFEKKIDVMPDLEKISALYLLNINWLFERTLSRMQKIKNSNISISEIINQPFFSKILEMANTLIQNTSIFKTVKEKDIENLKKEILLMRNSPFDVNLLSII